MDVDTDIKVLQYEEFLNERLRTDLKTTLDKKESVYSEISEYLQLKNVLEKMSSADLPGKNMKAMVDIGCDFYMKATVPNASYVIVSVGLNVYVQFTHEEALSFVEKKIKHLNEKADIFTSQAADTSARIKLIIEGLKELQFSRQLGGTTTITPRPVW